MHQNFSYPRLTYGYNVKRFYLRCKVSFVLSRSFLHLPASYSYSLFEFVRRQLWITECLIFGRKIGRNKCHIQTSFIWNLFWSDMNYFLERCFISNPSKAINHQTTYITYINHFKQVELKMLFDSSFDLIVLLLVVNRFNLKPFQ